MVNRREFLAGGAAAGLFGDVLARIGTEAIGDLSQPGALVSIW